MHIQQTKIHGVLILTPDRFVDGRGFFSESWNLRRMKAAGLDYNFVQDNHSLSYDKGTLRGLHVQLPPYGQAKLVRCGRGALFDVAVDVRHGSDTYGEWVGAELSFENGKQLLVPEGCLHGFVTREASTEIVYKCTEFYNPEADRSVRWDDAKIGIEWGITTAPLLSEKDAKASTLSQLRPIL